MLQHTALVVVAALGLGFVGVGMTRQPTPSHTQDHAVKVANALDGFHQAAANADEDTYFGLLTDDAVFLGTDPDERWTKDEFEAFAMPYFERPSAWIYTPKSRHVSIAPCGSVAWFDEVLENAKLGLCRGTGVLLLEDGTWRISQYNLTIPVPNALTSDLVDRIKAHNES